MTNEKKPHPAHQMSLESGDGGDLTPAFDSTETDLSAFGVAVMPDEKETRIARPKATEFGVDDRVETESRAKSGSDTRQEQLMSDPNQQELPDD